MGSGATRSLFASESAWPFKLHGSQLEICREFLAAQGSAPRILRIFGASGTGKSFLVRELMVQASADRTGGLGIYIDVPPGGIEASALFEKVDALLSGRREASRGAPSFVGRKEVRAWISAKRTSITGVSYGYGAFRDLVAQIPILGPFIKALLPQSMSIRATMADRTAAIRFLMRRSRSRPVLLAIDNTQFLPLVEREILSSELTEAGPHLRLVLVERVHNAPRIDWVPAAPGADVMDMDLGKASLAEVMELVNEVLPDAGAYGFEDIASAIFRRSEGNLKSVWYQLRLLASRLDDQEALPMSYEEVILDLPPPDQALLRFVVFTIGGLTIGNLVSLLRATDLQLGADVVTNAIEDLTTLGLLVVNGDRLGRVRVEHELVAQVVSETTPEDDKLDLRIQAVNALSAVLDDGATPSDEAVLYDRFMGIVSGVEVRQTPSLMAHVVRFIQIQSRLERHSYLASIFPTTVCWDVLDVLPETTVRSLLDAVQKSGLFDLGLVAATRLRRAKGLHESLAWLYYAKYLVQLFRYEEANAALERVPESKEKRAVAFNIMLNLAEDDQAAEIALEVYGEISEESGTEQDFLILRNSVHLFQPEEALALVTAALQGFESRGSRFGVATTRNNLGIVELASNSIGAARDTFETARRELLELGSDEIYQPLVNLSAVSLLDGDIGTARHLLSAAREAAPRSLMMDAAMFDLNEVCLDLCRRDRLELETVERMRAVAEAARGTRDVRFRAVATWFAESLEAVLSGGRGPAAGLPRRIEEMRTSGRVGLELFIPRKIAGVDLELPFVLSPHWRY